MVGLGPQQTKPKVKQLKTFKKNSQNSVIDEEPSEEKIHIALEQDESNENVDEEEARDNREKRRPTELRGYQGRDASMQPSTTINSPMTNTHHRRRQGISREPAGKFPSISRDEIQTSSYNSL